MLRKYTVSAVRAFGVAFNPAAHGGARQQRTFATTTSNKEVNSSAVNRDTKLINLIKYSKLGLDDIRLNERTEPVCLAAVEHDAFAIYHVPKHLFTEAVCVSAVRNNPTIYTKLLPENRTLAVNKVLLEHDPRLLSEIVPSQRRQALESVTLEKVLSTQYETSDFFHEDYPYEQARDSLLDNTDNVLLTSLNQVKDYEVHDVKMVYLNLPENVGKSIHTHSEYAKKLLDDLAKRRRQEINLVLIGHCTYGTHHIAGIDLPRLNNLLTSYTFIKQVVFFGCHTIDATVLTQEAAMVRQIAPQNIANEECGLLLLGYQPAASEYVNFLRQVNLRAMYILIKTTEKAEEQYLLQYVTFDNSNKMSINELHLNQDQCAKIEKVLTEGKKLVFPKRNNEKYLFRHRNKPMTEREVGFFQYLFNESNYPFNNDFNINHTEIPKLQTSFISRAVDSIAANAKITRPVLLKGYPRTISVDTQNRTFHHAKKGLYHAYDRSLFTSGKKNISQAELNQERQGNIQALSNFDFAGKTTARSITVELDKSASGFSLFARRSKLGGFSPNESIQQLGRRALQETFETLRDYGLTETAWQDFIAANSPEICMYAKDTLIYLVTGRYPFTTIVSGSRSVVDLAQEMRFTPAQAIEEIRGLCEDRQAALIDLYQHGLRGEHLRRFGSTPSTFMFPHRQMLSYYMLDVNPALSPSAAVDKVLGVSFDQAHEFMLVRTQEQRALRNERYGLQSMPSIRM